MGAIIGPVAVENPTPAAQRYGLFPAAVGPLPLPQHARGGGVWYRDRGTNMPDGMEVVCESQTLTFDAGCGALVTGVPFYVLATMNTGSIAMPQDEIRQVLLEQLFNNEQSVVENVFSEGSVGQANSLANNATAPTALTAATGFQSALGRLDGWLASVTSRRGIIHVPATYSSYFTSDIGVYREGGRYYSQMGNVISFGNYSGNKANGDAPAAAHTTIYACESTTVWRTPDSDILVSPYNANLDLGRFVESAAATNNQINAMALREYVVTHNNIFANIDVTV
jgi:hypothetical protein